MTKTTHDDLTTAIREGVTELLTDIGERYGCGLPETLAIAAEVVTMERDQRVHAKVTRISALNSSVRVPGLNGVETYDVYDDGKRVRITTKHRGRARGVKPDTPDWRKVMKAYREAGN